MRRRYISGMLAGWALWLALYAAAFTIEASETYWPRLLRDADLPDTLGSMFLVAALPVAVGGWLLAWGDGAQPPSWLTGMPFNVLFGLVIYGALGVAAARHWGAITSLTRRALRGIKPSVSKRALPWIVVVAAIFAAWTGERNRISGERHQRAVKALAIERAKFDAARAELKAQRKAAESP